MAANANRVTRFGVGEDDRLLVSGRFYRYDSDYEHGIVVRSDDDKPKHIFAITWQELDGQLRGHTLKVEKGYYSRANAVE